MQGTSVILKEMLLLGRIHQAFRQILNIAKRRDVRSGEIGKFVVRRVIPCPLGEIQFVLEVSGHWEDLAALERNVIVGPYTPELPEGWSVKECHAIGVTLSPMRDLTDIVMHCRLVTKQPLQIGPSTGECLEAIVFRGRDHVLLIGTADDEALTYQLEGVAEWPERPSTQAPDGIRVQVHRLFGGHRIELHVLVAWAPSTEEGELAACYAVDAKTSEVLSALGQKQVMPPGRP